jgi:hypothetical protein
LDGSNRVNDNFAEQVAVLVSVNNGMLYNDCVSSHGPHLPTYVSVAVIGLREGHEPYRHLATQAAIAFLETRSPHLLKAGPALVKPLRLALQTYEPSLVGHALLMLQR